MSKKDRFGLVGNTIASTFRVDEVVAEGGFGVVYRAFHLHFRSPVALKCLKIPVELSVDERQAFLEQFRSEAEIMFRLSSTLSHIVRPLHVDAVQSTSGEFVPFMALEWLDGKSFEKLIEERVFRGLPPMPLDELVELLTPAAHALAQAHEFPAQGETLSVVHRDVKPDNLFLCTSGAQRSVKILDFGISKVKRSAAETAGQFKNTSGQAPFSPAYGAPEQWVPKRYGATGPWTDVWGLALTLVEIIKGEAVIVGDHQAMMGTALDAKVRPTPRSEGVEVADEVEAVFQKALAVDPRYRYRSVRDFWSSLEEAMRVGGAGSERRIRIESHGAFSSKPALPSSLPPMSAPTPWTPPVQSRSATENLGGPQPGLPPMLAPAPLVRSRPEDLRVESFYPNDPSSGLAPVPPAPGSHDPDEIEIPRLDDEDHGGASRRSHTAARPTSSHRAETIPVEIEIELQPTSIFPDAGSHALEPSDEETSVVDVESSPPIPDLDPLPLVPARRGRRETG